MWTSQLSSVHHQWPKDSPPIISTSDHIDSSRRTVSLSIKGSGRSPGSSIWLTDEGGPAWRAQISREHDRDQPQTDVCPSGKEGSRKYITKSPGHRRSAYSSMRPQKRQRRPQDGCASWATGSGLMLLGHRLGIDPSQSGCLVEGLSYWTPLHNTRYHHWWHVQIGVCNKWRKTLRSNDKDRDLTTKTWSMFQTVYRPSSTTEWIWTKQTEIIRWTWIYNWVTFGVHPVWHGCMAEWL